jgi:hypothetical protein
LAGNSNFWQEIQFFWREIQICDKNLNFWRKVFFGGKFKFLAGYSNFGGKFKFLVGIYFWRKIQNFGGKFKFLRKIQIFCGKLFLAGNSYFLSLKCLQTFLLK